MESTLFLDEGNGGQSSPQLGLRQPSPFSEGAAPLDNGAARPLDHHAHRQHLHAPVARDEARDGRRVGSPVRIRSTEGSKSELGAGSAVGPSQMLPLENHPPAGQLGHRRDSVIVHPTGLLATSGDGNSGRPSVSLLGRVRA